MIARASTPVTTMVVIGTTNEAIALNGELYALLADHQPETGVIKIVVTRKEQEIFPRNLAGGGVKDCLEMPGG